MRCQCCDRNLNDYESTRKHAETGDYLDICNKCISDLPEIPVEVRGDLSPYDELEEDFDWDDFAEEEEE
jgi:hypothetical protein